MRTFEYSLKPSVLKPTLIHPDYLTILHLLSAVFVLSVFSGFQSNAVPKDLAWAFSPIGLFTSLFRGFPAQYSELATGTYFHGPSGWSLDYAGTFLKTCLFESPFYLWCLRHKTLPRALKTLLLSNLMTHPAVFFIFPLLFSKYRAAALSSEFFAASIEMSYVGIIVLRERGFRAGAMSSLAILLANLFSWEMGMLIS